MWHMAIQSKQGNLYRLRNEAGRTRGKALFAIVVPLSNYCRERDTDEDFTWKSWFANLERQADSDFCERTRYFVKACFPGEWDYKAGDYLRYKRDYGESAVSEEEFLAIVEKLDKIWTEKDKLLSSVRYLVDLLAKAQPEYQEGLYDPNWTPEEFTLLEAALRSLPEGQSLVRLNIY